MIRIVTAYLIAVIILLLCPLPIPASDIVLTQEEDDWLKKNPVIRVSGPQAFPPFQFADDKGTFAGMAPDYLAHIGKTLGITFEYAPRQPWPEILQKVEKKEIDLLSCAAKTPERLSYLAFSNDHLVFPLVIITRKEAGTVRGIEDLAGIRVAFVRKNVTFDWLQQEKVNSVPVFVSTPLEALTAVALGQADAYIENLAAASYLIEKNGLTNLKIAAPTPFNNYALAIGVRNDWPELVSLVNKALASISPKTHNEIRQNWISVRYEHGIRVIDIIKWVALVSVVAICLIAAFLLWNRRLTREIEERKKAEAEKEKLITELTTALEEIKTLRGILPICSSCKKIKDDSGYWNRLETYIGDHSEADFSHSMCPDCMQEMYGHEEWFDEAD